MTLAGFAAEDSLWADFDINWRRILGDNRKRPKAAYLHMREAVHCKGEFSHHNGWNLSKVQSLLLDLLQYLKTVDKQRFRQFSCTIDLEAQKKLQQEGLDLEDPIDRCNRLCPEMVLNWYMAKHPALIIHSAHYFFDLDEPFEERFKAKWVAEKNRNILLSFEPQHFIWSLVKSVTASLMRDTPPLQAADLLAWSSNRSASGNPDASFMLLEPLLRSLIPSSWSFWKEEDLRAGKLIRL
ncbi:MAG: hypothetical protein ACLP1Y_16845 [Candidatus Acidiferrales bacterium]